MRRQGLTPASTRHKANIPPSPQRTPRWNGSPRSRDQIVTNMAQKLSADHRAATNRTVKANRPQIEGARCAKPETPDMSALARTKRAAPRLAKRLERHG